MKKLYNRLLFATILSILTAYTLQAQSSSNAAGGNVSGSTGSVSYSIGQLFYEPVNNTQVDIVPGVQHAFEITILSVYDTQIDQSINIYPNPTLNLLNVNKGTQKELFGYKLFDMQGKMMNEGVLRDQNTTINMLPFPGGAYILQVTSQENGEFKTFNVVKK